MGFSKLKYTRDWRNEDDFPAVVTDETQVRADQQALFEEVKEHVNKVADELDAEHTRCEDTYATKQALQDLVRDEAVLPNESITLEKLSPEVLDRSYTKDETWTAETKAEYGMEAGAIPDAALSALAPLLHNWWAREKAQPQEPYVVKEFAVESQFLGSWNDETSRLVLYTANSFATDQSTGLFRLIGATTVKYQDVRNGTLAPGAFLAWQTEGVSILVRWKDGAVIRAKRTSGYFTYDVYVQNCDVIRAVTDAAAFEFATTRPESGDLGEEYTLVGNRLDTAPGLPQMAWGRPVKYCDGYYAPGDSSSDPETRTSKYLLNVGFNPICIWSDSGQMIVPSLAFEGQDYYRDGMILLPNGFAGKYYFAIGL